MRHYLARSLRLLIALAVLGAMAMPITRMGVLAQEPASPVAVEPSSTAIPTAEPSPTALAAEDVTDVTDAPVQAAAVINATIDYDQCDYRSDGWTFQIINLTSLEANPTSIDVTFTDGVVGVPRSSNNSYPGGLNIALYDLAGSADKTLVGASATGVDGVVYNFVLFAGPPCTHGVPSATATTIPPSNTPTDTATATATSSPSSTSTATVTPTATLSGIEETINATIDLDACELNSDLWLFELSNTINPGAFPLTITANFNGDPGVVVPLLASGVIDGVFVALYSWDQNLGDTLESATAVVDAGIDYTFRLIEGPPCAEPTTLTPTPSSTIVSRVTLTPTQTASATASATATATATATGTTPPTNTATATGTATASATSTATSSNTATTTSTATATVTATSSPTMPAPPTKTASPIPTRTHPPKPPVWATHTPKPQASITPVPGLPATGSGSFGSGSGLALLAGTVVLAGLGLAIRRRKLMS